MNEEAGIFRRGMLLFVTLAAIAAAVLFTILYRSEPNMPPETVRAEALVPTIVTPAAPFPGTCSWGTLYQLAEVLPSAPGWETRYQATLALAHRGSPHVRLSVLREMLDESRQMRNFRGNLKSGQEVPEEVAARQTVLGALKAVVEWHKHADAVAAVGSDNSELQQIYAAIDQLSHSSNQVVSAEAEKVRQALKHA